MDTNRLVKIIDSSCEEKNNIIKLKVKDIQTGKEVTWVLSGDDFDSFVGQFIKDSLSFTSKQREAICKEIVGKQFNSSMESDLEKDIVKDIKDNKEVENFHKVMDQYPFYEILEEMLGNEENKED
jgi:hypothetical protein